jgi:hypothetical protein
MANLKIITAAFTEKDQYSLEEISSFLFPVGDPGGQIVRLSLRNQGEGYRCDFGHMSVKPGQEVDIISEHLGLSLPYTLNGIESPQGTVPKLTFISLSCPNPFRRLELVATISV